MVGQNFSGYLSNNLRLWLWLPILICAAALALWSNVPYDVDDAGRRL